jgi:DNA-binding MarR family transcriptional regulator
MAKDGSLTTRQRRAIAALLTNPTIGEAAEAARVGERTLHRWLADLSTADLERLMALLDEDDDATIAELLARFEAGTKRERSEYK